MKPNATTPVMYRIKVVLKGSQPTIWRRILVCSDLTLRTLHTILQEVMGWTNSHLHQFVIEGQSYGRPDPDGVLDFLDDSKFRLGDLLTGKGDRFSYEYDFGDSWDHSLIVEEVLPVDAEKPSALCLAGARACPPEDVGGLGGYDAFLETIADPKHPEHKETLRWAGGAFDPEAFDLNQVNRTLQRVVRRPRQLLSK